MMSDLVKRHVPVDLIFSRSPMVDEQHEYYGELAEWQDTPLVTLAPHRAAIETIVNRTDSIDAFLEFEKKRTHPHVVDAAAVEVELRRRCSPVTRLLGRQMPVVRALDRDRLILDEGEIYCCREKMRGASWVAVRMTQEVAEEWDSRPTEELDAEVARQSRKSFYTPIMHPKYRKWPVSRQGTRRLDLMRTFLGPIRQGLSLLDIGCNTGFYSFHFFRQGLQVSGLDFSEEHLAIARAQRSMYSAPIEFDFGSFADFVPTKRFDLVLGLSVFWHMLGWGTFPPSLTPGELASKLDALVGTALFWESGKRGAEMIELITKQTGLKYFTELGRTHATGIENRQFGVFTRRPHPEVRNLLGRGVSPSTDSSSNA